MAASAAATAAATCTAVESAGAELAAASAEAAHSIAAAGALLPRDYILVIIFVLGYVAITIEHNIHINKGTSAITLAVVCWLVVFVSTPDKELATEELYKTLADVSSIVFFLLGAVTIVELMDSHGGFRVIRRAIRIRSKRKLLWFVGFLTFFVSSVLDNLTTTIGMLSLLRNLLPNRDDRLVFGSIVVIAANAGGAWTCIGDVTTTMLWIGNQISVVGPMKSLLIPSAISLAVSLAAQTPFVRGSVAPLRASAEDPPAKVAASPPDSIAQLPAAAPDRERELAAVPPDEDGQLAEIAVRPPIGRTWTAGTLEGAENDKASTTAPLQRRASPIPSTLAEAPPEERTQLEAHGRLVLAVGIGSLLFVPVLKLVTHLPPFMGILLGLAAMWLVTDKAHEKSGRHNLRVPHALSRIDITSILFFLGILLAVSTLSVTGLLKKLATVLSDGVRSGELITLLIGLLSSVVDNVPLVAAAMRMYNLTPRGDEPFYPTDSPFWLLLAYCAGTGGSILIIGSAAGVAFMGLEKVNFFWYAKRIAPVALAGYLAGFAWFMLQMRIPGWL